MLFQFTWLPNEVGFHSFILCTFLNRVRNVKGQLLFSTCSFLVSSEPVILNVQPLHALNYKIVASFL